MVLAVAILVVPVWGGLKGLVVVGGIFTLFVVVVGGGGDGSSSRS